MYEQPELVSHDMLADSERPPRELEQFIHSYRLPHPDTYKSMLTTSATRGATSVKLVSNLDHEFEPSSKRRRCEEDMYLRRVRSLVQPLQVQIPQLPWHLYAACQV